MKSTFVRRLLDLLAPRSCCGCGARLTLSEKVVCASCLLQLPRTYYAEDPFSNPVAKLYFGRLHVERAAAWLRYAPDNVTSQVVKTLKYHNQPSLGHLLGRIMAGELLPSHFFDGIDVLMPIPLTSDRLRERGYNQSLLVAQGLSAATGLPIANGVVTRTTFHQSQTRLMHADRQKNVEGVFHLEDAEAVANQHVLIIDDVVTTGSTTISFGNELLKAKNVKVSILALTFTNV